MSTQNHITSRPQFPDPRFPASTENHTARVSRECQSKRKTISAAQVNALTCAAERRIRFDGLTKSILAEPDTPTVSLRPYHKGLSFGELGRARLRSCSSNTARRGRQSFYHFHALPPCATTYSLRHIHRFLTFVSLALFTRSFDPYNSIFAAEEVLNGRLIKATISIML